MFGLKKYIYCQVTFDGTKTYHYRTNDTRINVGTQVIVPVGKYNAWKIGMVMSVGLFKRKDVPYPVNKTKKILMVAGVNADRKVERYNRKLFNKLKKEQEKTVKEIAKKSRKRIERDWIDCIEEYDALFND